MTDTAPKPNLYAALLNYQSQQTRQRCDALTTYEVNVSTSAGARADFMFREVSAVAALQRALKTLEDSDAPLGEVHIRVKRYS